jgi:hypothetical protein
MTGKKRLDVDLAEHGSAVSSFRGNALSTLGQKLQQFNRERIVCGRLRRE